MHYLSYLWRSVLLLGLVCSCTQQNIQERTQGFISLSPAITETIFALGAQDKLIGRSDYCHFPSEAQTLPSFGTALTPNLEQIAQKKSEGLLFDGAFGSPKKELSAISEIHVYPWLSSKDMASSIEKLGDVMEKPKEANALAQKIRTVLAPKIDASSPSMIALMSGSDLKSGVFWYMRADSLHGEAVEAAGFRNVAPKDIHGTPNMSAEALLAQDPDLIIFICSPEIDTKAAQKFVDQMSRFPTLKAVQNKRVGYIIGENRMGIGPTITDLVYDIQREGSALLDTK